MHEGSDCVWEEGGGGEEVERRDGEVMPRLVRCWWSQFTRSVLLVFFRGDMSRCRHAIKPPPPPHHIVDRKRDKVCVSVCVCVCVFACLRVYVGVCGGGLYIRAMAVDGECAWKAGSEPRVR